MKNICHVVTNQKSVAEKRPVFCTEESKRLSNNALLSRRLFLSDFLLNNSLPKGKEGKCDMKAKGELLRGERDPARPSVKRIKTVHENVIMKLMCYIQT